MSKDREPNAAYSLMRNPFHLMTETPEANLVAAHALAVSGQLQHN
jgi:hypothetical protein